MNAKRYTYQDFWAQHGRQSFWLTRHVSYRLGALLAVPAARLGLSPNFVSLLSLLTGLGGAIAAARLPTYGWAGAGVLLVTLHLSYGLDCADGLLARATGKGSLFGQIFDKVVDLAGSILLPFILAESSLDDGAAVLSPGSLLPVLALAVVSRPVLSVAIWLKELALHRMERLREDHRPKTPLWYAKKIMGNLCDDVTYRTALPLAWGLGWFWEFLLAFNLIVFVMFMFYLHSSWKEMAAPVPEPGAGI